MWWWSSGDKQVIKYRDSQFLKFNIAYSICWPFRTFLQGINATNLEHIWKFKFLLNWILGRRESLVGRTHALSVWGWGLTPGTALASWTLQGVISDYLKTWGPQNKNQYFKFENTEALIFVSALLWTWQILAKIKI